MVGKIAILERVLPLQAIACFGKAKACREFPSSQCSPGVILGCTRIPTRAIRKFYLLITVAVFLFIAYKYFSSLDQWELQPDEHEYLRRGELLELWLTHQWRLPAWETFEVFDHPSVGGYTYGLGLYLSGRRPIGQYFTKINFNEGLELSRREHYQDFGDLWKPQRWWIKAAGKPIAELKNQFPQYYQTLMVGRYTAVVLSLLALLMLFLWLRIYFPQLLSWLGVILIAFHPLSLRSATLPRTMLEAPLLFFLSLSGLMTAYWAKKFIKNNTKRNGNGWGWLMGGSSALAIGVKLTGLVMPVSIVIFLFFQLVKTVESKLRFRQIFKILWRFLGSLSLTFLVVNPQLYGAPINGLFKFYVMRQRFTLWQLVHPEAGLPLLSFSSRLVAAWSRLFFNPPLLTYPWWGWLLMLLFMIGLGYLGEKTVRSLRQFRFAIEEFVFWWVMVSFWLIVSFLPVNEERYLFPLVLPVVFCQMFGIQFLIRLIKLNFKLRGLRK